MRNANEKQRKDSKERFFEALLSTKKIWYYL